MLTPINIPLGSSKLALRLEELDIDLDDLDLEKFPIQVVRLLNTPVDSLHDDETLCPVSAWDKISKLIACQIFTWYGRLL